MQQRAKDTMRGNTWTLTLKLEDAADLAAYIADPDDGWPLVEDEATMLEAVRRFFRGRSIALPNGGRVDIVDLELSPPEAGEFLTERRFRNESAGEQEAVTPRTEWPQDAREAFGMVLSAWEYVWRARKDHTEARDARSYLQEAAYEIQDAAGIDRETGEDLETQVRIKWETRKRLGMWKEHQA